MRHLERTHGISIMSLHEHFVKDHFILMYEITSKMAADIHEGFQQPIGLALINQNSVDDLSTKQFAEMVAPATDVDTTVRQAF